MAKFRQKYRIETARARFWDYGWNGGYFVTICTKNRACFFGDVVNGRINLSPIGHIANSCWYEIPNHFPFVKLGPHVVMPNHVHGIVIIDKRDENDDDSSNDHVETQNVASLRDVNETNTNQSKNKFGPQSQNLPSIIRGYKTGVTKNARLIDPGFAWQPRYHDRIIRDDGSYQIICEYISDNPANWREDEFYKNGMFR